MLTVGGAAFAVVGVLVYSRRSFVYSRRSMFAVGGAPKQGRGTP